MTGKRDNELIIVLLRQLLNFIKFHGHIEID
jgi:hypothetical protein